MAVTRNDDETVELNNGRKIPAVGFGTWQLEDPKALTAALDDAYSAGYRLVDTAKIYGNEAVIGSWLKTKKRDELFITSKLWNSDHGRVGEACDGTLKRLGIECLDLYLVHFPVSSEQPFDAVAVWRDMEKLVAAGKARSIGVANFGRKNLTKILDVCKIKPAMCQVELHVYLQQKELREFCRSKGIAVTSYSSLGSSSCKENLKMRENQVVAAVAKKHGLSPEQILLSFPRALGCCIIPRSKSKAHIISNRKLAQLDGDDLKQLAALDCGHRFVDLPEFGEHRFD